MPARTTCRICQTPLPAPFFDLGPMPLANAFLSDAKDFAGEPVYPLAVSACGTCGLVQLDYVVPAEQLYRDYIYVSSTSDAVRVHAERIAESLIGQYGWTPSALVVEVASNDGTVLKSFRNRQVRVLGVEPARNIAVIAEADGVPTIAEFFDSAVATAIRTDHGHAAAILGRHVFAHVDDVHEFLDGVDALLDRDGVFVIEVPYLGEMLQKGEFDTIYHEHLSYISLGPMQRLCATHGFELVDVERIDLHGGSILLHMCRRGVRKPSERLQRMLEQEHALDLTGAPRLAAFADRIRVWKGQFEELIGSTARAGGVLVGYGAAAKANTLLNYCPAVARSLGLILDRSQHKCGKYTPGTHIRVESADGWTPSTATHMVILAWNFQGEIMRQMRDFKARGGRFIIPIPEPRVV